MEEQILRIKKDFVPKYEDGYPLITEEACANPQILTEEGRPFRLEAGDGTFLGRGYYGRQNKGLGWVLTQKEHEPIDERLFQKKLAVALGRRTSLFMDETTNTFRILNGEGDGLGGLTIDYFNGYYLLQWYSAGAYTWQKTIVDLLFQNTDAVGVYEKKRFSSEGGYVSDDDFVTGERAPEPLLVKENGMTFAVYLNDGAMTGLFLDQRDVRQTLRETVPEDARVLNTFSYTGAFSVACALGGAGHTVNVDAANRSLEKTKEQFEVNGLDPASHQILVEDVFTYFRRAIQRGEQYDVVILDPPSFARTKKTTFSAVKDYGKLLEQAFQLTAPGGIVAASTNHAGLYPKKFRAFIYEAMEKTETTGRIKSTFRLPEDFRVDADYPDGNYLKVHLIEKSAEGGLL
ncbi:class I SAM-dependent rRNA methyltransferase [Alkalicoccus urumqiensis]|uniref:RlmI/RlmK family 23S rRNA methyltransferase n=1 Tax=Alkalicoccus urumqiensis TaxID=1548213 RepID=A0A2P6MK39_ALKUR|nr:class I SAM-dependent rRNA methyltransferase [Alkalicoccus urumqiensis]PRO66647.1 RlmI/RlmK family 23S rRNA methyltransferase [Alkalicoccus urumqiensis]